MKKRMMIMLIGVGILFGGIFLYKGFMTLMMKRYFATMKSPTVTVSTMKVGQTSWTNELKAAGSMRTVRGVNVTTSLAGQVQTIYFKPGSVVQQDTVLVQLNASVENAQLESLMANADLARINYERDTAQFKVHAVSKAQVDTDRDNLKSLRAQVAEQAAVVAKKTIRAPFTGKLGVSAINLGQYLNAGDKIVSLQTLDPIYADFYLPQQSLSAVHVGQKITMTSDAYPGKTFAGVITTIEPEVDSSTRNVEVEATCPNRDSTLVPGMFTTVVVDTGNPQEYLTLPQTAITYNPYGNVVYLVKEKGEDDNGKPVLVAKQVFVKTGETRGDQIMVIDGIDAGDTVVTSGQLKLKNGSHIVVNNTVQPANNPNPKLPDEE